MFEVYLYIHIEGFLEPLCILKITAFPILSGFLQCCSFTSSSSSLDAKYSSDFNFLDAAWRLVMQHSNVRYPSESRAESTKEKASSGYILLSSHTAWSRLQLGWGVCKWGVLTAHCIAIKFMPVVNQLPLDRAPKDKITAIVLFRAGE